MSCKTNWHVEAVGLAARFPYKPWGEICASVAARRSPPIPKPTVRQFTNRLEQLKLF